MSQTDPLGEILESYRKTCFLVKDTLADNPKALKLMAATIITTKAAINAEIAKAVREDRERIRLLLVEYGVLSSQIFNPTTEELRTLWHEIAQLELPHEI